MYFYAMLHCLYLLPFLKIIKRITIVIVIHLVLNLKNTMYAIFAVYNATMLVPSYSK